MASRADTCKLFAAKKERRAPTSFDVCPESPFRYISICKWLIMSDAASNWVLVVDSVGTYLLPTSMNGGIELS